MSAITNGSALPSQRLAGKVALITGGGGNIGLETAKRFVQEGAKVVLVDLNPQALSSALKQLENIVPTGVSPSTVIHGIEADVTAEADVKRFMEETVTKFGSLDCTFLNAGVNLSAAPIVETDEEKYDFIMRVNVKSAYMGVKHAGIVMQKLGKGGSIVLTSSIAGLRGTPGVSVYATSKFAIRGLALTAAGEFGPHNIRVNTIHPSGLNTPMFHDTWGPEKVEQMRTTFPLGRFAEVDDISGVVAFLASDDSKFMTGAMLKVDGGCHTF